MPNCVYVHDQNAVIGWKHKNYRTGRAAAIRNRASVLRTIITVANYECILDFQFDQAGKFMYEVRATGICPHSLMLKGVPYLGAQSYILEF